MWLNQKFCFCNFSVKKGKEKKEEIISYNSSDAFCFCWKCHLILMALVGKKKEKKKKSSSCSDGTLLHPLCLLFVLYLKGENWTECKYQETHLALLLWICMVSNAWMDFIFHIAIKHLNRLGPQKENLFWLIRLLFLQKLKWESIMRERFLWNRENTILLLFDNVITHAITLSSDMPLLIGYSKTMLSILQLGYSKTMLSMLQLSFSPIMEVDLYSYQVAMTFAWETK